MTNGKDLLKIIKENNSRPSESDIHCMVYEYAKGLGKSNVFQPGSGYSYWTSFTQSIMEYDIIDPELIAEAVNSFHEVKETTIKKFLGIKYKSTDIYGAYTLPGTSKVIHVEYVVISGSYD